MSQQRTPVTTHHVEVHATEVRKTYRCTDHDEPAREWAALQHLATHAPDLAPAPLRRERDGDDEVLVMSRLPGGLLTGPVTPQQTRALGHALRRLLSVPLPPGVPVRSNPPAELRARYAPWLAEATPAGARTTQAVGAALAWLAEHRRHFACFWLAMLLPGRPAAHRNPPGALADQAEHVLTLLGNS